VPTRSQQIGLLVLLFALIVFTFMKVTGAL